MVWPSTRSPQGLETGKTLERTILGKYYSETYRPKYGLWRKSPSERLEELKSLPLWGSLPRDVLSKYARAEFSDVKRIIYLWRAIETCIIVSTPELLGKPVSSLHRRLWRWVVTSAIHSYEATAASWKKVCLYFRDYTQTLENDQGNAFPRGVPGGTNGHAGPLWFEMMPWLLDFAIAKMTKSKSSINSRLIERVAHLIQSRTMPPPPLSDKRFDKEVFELREQFKSKPPLSADRRYRTDRAVERLCNYLEAQKGNDPYPHISLNATGCYEKPRTSGGKSIFLSECFINRMVRKNPTRVVNSKTWCDVLTLR